MSPALLLLAYIGLGMLLIADVWAIFCIIRIAGFFVITGVLYWLDTPDRFSPRVFLPVMGILAAFSATLIGFAIAGFLLVWAIWSLH